MVALLVAASPLVRTAASAENSDALQIYFVDVEGGQATLFVTPGQSLLIDTGWPGDRDAGRIAAVAKLAKIQKIDFVLITHYHQDHVGGLPTLAGKIPIGTFLDHGPLREPGKPMDDDFAAYQKVLSTGRFKHSTLKPGDELSIAGLEVVVVSADGNVLDHALPGAGQPNPYCKATEPQGPDPSENARSLGTVLTFGKLRILDLGDLTWDKEMELMCPNNKLGKIDIYVVSHHGSAESGSPALVDAIAPRVAVMDNGATKGGSAKAWQTIESAPGLETLWQLHYAEKGGKDHNVDEAYIANEGTADEGNYIKIAAHQDGSFTVFNSRNKLVKTYAAR